MGIMYASQVARRLRVTKMTILRFHGHGLNPKRNAVGWWVYDREEVEEFAKAYAQTRRRRKRTAELTLDEQAAKCYEHFVADSDLATIVIDVGVTPEKVKAWYKEWKAGLEREREMNAEEKIKYQTENLKLEAERVKIEGRRDRNLADAMGFDMKKKRRVVGE